MKEQIALLIKLGLPEHQAIAFVKGVAEDAYEAGEYAGRQYEPAIIGESLGKSGQDFCEWFEEELS